MPQSSCCNFLRGKLLGQTGKTDPLGQIATIPKKELRIFEGHILGSGSSGVVYKGKAYEEVVAIKLFKENFNLSDRPSAARDEFEQEVLKLMALSHENVISFRGVCLNPPCIVTEYCPHGSLYDFLYRKNDKLENILQISCEEKRKKKELHRWKRRLKLVIGIAKGIYYLHHRPHPIIHRDFKSPNVVLKKDNTPTITDFGLARHRPARIQDGINPTWAAPEVVINNQAACQKSDIFAFAIVMCEILTGERPWNGSQPVRIRYHLETEERPTVPAELPQDWPGVGQYVELMRNCWAQTREDRPCIKDIISSLKAIWSMTNPTQHNAVDLIPVPCSQAQQVETMPKDWCFKRMFQLAFAKLFPWTVSQDRHVADTTNPSSTSQNLNREIPSGGHQDPSNEGMAETGTGEIELTVQDNPSASCRDPSEISWDLQNMNEVVGEGPQYSGGAHSSTEWSQIQSPFLTGGPSLPPLPS